MQTTRLASTSNDQYVAQIHALRFQQQGHDYLASFTGQNVVSAAGGRRVHGLHADASLDQTGEPSGLRKAQALTTAEQNQLGTTLG